MKNEVISCRYVVFCCDVCLVEESSWQPLRVLLSIAVAWLVSRNFNCVSLKMKARIKKTFFLRLFCGN